MVELASILFDNPSKVNKKWCHPTSRKAPLTPVRTLVMLASHSNTMLFHKH